ncbi:MAG: CARDB domain-containing protein, partial [Cyanobacteriota bacterium]|nr:CARDB domain-containing protein [Cyanobacteriota bacterium]
LTIDLSSVFTDPDSTITFVAPTNNNPSLVSATVEGNNLILDYVENKSGTAEITVGAESNGKTVTDSLTVTVNPVDDSPVVANAIADIKVDEGSANTTIDISKVFTDIDNNDTAISKIIKTNSNSSLVTSTVNGNTLTLDYQDNKSGNTNITVEGTSNGKTIADTFAVSVTAKPNLVVQNQSAPSSANAGSAISIGGTVKNIGSGYASSSYVRYYLSDDTTFSSSDTYLGSDYVSSLSAGRSSYESASVTIPSTTSTGTKYVLFVADHNKSVSESNENNNVAYKSLYVNNRPDLVVQNQSAPYWVRAGSTINISATVKNTGGSNAGGSYVRYYLSDDTTFNRYSDTYLGYDYVSSLSSGRSSYESASVTIPSTTTSGTKYVLFVADYNNWVSEGNENNNVAYRSIYTY